MTIRNFFGYILAGLAGTNFGLWILGSSLMFFGPQPNANNSENGILELLVAARDSRGIDFLVLGSASYALLQKKTSDSDSSETNQG